MPAIYNENKIDNLIIAEFMNLKLIEEEDWIYYIAQKNGRKDITPEELKLSNLSYYRGENDSCELKFHKSWDWLMPVIEKIENMGFDTMITFNHNPYSKRDDKMWHWCQIGKDKTAEALFGSGNNEVSKILTVHNAVVKFIEWYNKEQKK